MFLLSSRWLKKAEEEERTGQFTPSPNASWRRDHFTEEIVTWSNVEWTVSVVVVAVGLFFLLRLSYQQFNRVEYHSGILLGGYFSSSENQTGELRDQRARFFSEGLHAIIRTEAGRITLRLAPQSDIPEIVGHFLKLVESHYYKGACFVRAEPGFLLQVDGRKKDGSWKLNPLPPLNFNTSSAKYKNIEGAVAFAGRPPKQSFFINLNDNSRWLGPKGAYGASDPGDPVFAHVEEGWDVIQRIVNSKTTLTDGMHMLDECVEIFDITISVRDRVKQLKSRRAY